MSNVQKALWASRVFGARCQSPKGPLGEQGALVPSCGRHVLVTVSGSFNGNWPQLPKTSLHVRCTVYGWVRVWKALILGNTSAVTPQSVCKYRPITTYHYRPITYMQGQYSESLGIHCWSTCMVSTLSPMDMVSTLRDTPAYESHDAWLQVCVKLVCLKFAWCL